jgi:hypothetical protein
LISGFLLASRGIFSLGTFLAANWPAIRAYLRNDSNNTTAYSTTTSAAYSTSAVSVTAVNSQDKNTSNNNNNQYVPPKEEEEQVQLNIALQREIVNFTALGIQRSVRDMEKLRMTNESQRSSSTRYSSFNLFVSYSIL